MAVLLKWWRSRLVNGYKHMAGEMCETDSEQMNRYGSALATRCTCHLCLQHEYRLRSSKDRTIRETCEAVSCCVHTKPLCPEQEEGVKSQSADSAVERLQCDDDKKEQLSPPDLLSKTEFNFTLYDLDGHGVITKDDVASLVHAIYEVVGARVHVPASGSKTINVKLTVSDQPERTSAPTYPADGSLDTDDTKLKSQTARGRCSRGGSGSSNHRPLVTSDSQRLRPLNSPKRHLASEEPNNFELTRGVEDGCTSSDCRQFTPAASHTQRQDYELLNRCAKFAAKIAHTPCEQQKQQGGRNLHQQHRHRHRQREHYRAMRQVIDWLEKEHAQSQAPPTGHAPLINQAPPTDKTTPLQQQRQQASTECAAEPVFCRSCVEHHHVHHHYHHFNSLSEAVVL